MIGTKSTSIRDIERRVNLEKSKVSRAAAKLEAKGFITKQTDDNDRRLLKLALTSDGNELLGKLTPVAQSFQSELNGMLGDQEIALKHALDLLTENFDD